MERKKLESKLTIGEIVQRSQAKTFTPRAWRRVTQLSALVDLLLALFLVVIAIDFTMVAVVCSRSIIKNEREEDYCVQDAETPPPDDGICSPCGQVFVTLDGRHEEWSGIKKFGTILLIWIVVIYIVAILCVPFGSTPMLIASTFRHTLKIKSLRRLARWRLLWILFIGHATFFYVFSFVAGFHWILGLLIFLPILFTRLSVFLVVEKFRRLIVLHGGDAVATGNDAEAAAVEMKTLNGKEAEAE